MNNQDEQKKTAADNILVGDFSRQTNVSETPLTAESLNTESAKPVAASATTATVITLSELKQSHGESAAAVVYDRISSAGGFGSFGSDFYGGKPALDLTHCTSEQRSEIEKILKEGK